MTTTAETSTELSLSALLRTATRAEHEQAETMPFVAELMAGRLDRAAYADLAAQHYAIYSALEVHGRALVAADPVGGSMVFDELERVPALEADLAYLYGPRWRDEITLHPATQRYVERLGDVCAWAGGYVAHAYTRYLGDLSGGQVIKRMLERGYGFTEEGISFYTFPEIEKPKVFKDQYRACMDSLPWDAVVHERVADEARVAFSLNTAMFADLGAVHCPNA